MDPLTLIGLAAIGGALASDQPPKKPKIHPAILPMVVRRLGYSWKNFHLNACICNAPSWQQPCPWCGYYAPRDPEMRFTREEWCSRVSAKGRSEEHHMFEGGNYWLPNKLIANARRAVQAPHADIRFLTNAMRWFEWPTPEEVWNTFYLRDVPPIDWGAIPGDRELRVIGARASTISRNEYLGSSSDYNRGLVILGYNEEVRLKGPQDLASIQDGWSPEFKEKWAAWVERAPQRLTKRLLGQT